VATPALVDGETVSTAARDGKVVAGKTIVRVCNIRVEFAGRVTIRASTDGGRSPVDVDAVTLQARDRLSRPSVLSVALRVGCLPRIGSDRVTRRAGRFIQRSMTCNVGLNAEQALDDESETGATSCNVTSLTGNFHMPRSESSRVL